MTTIREVSSNVDGFPRGKNTLLQPLPNNTTNPQNGLSSIAVKAGKTSSTLSMVPAPTTTSSSSSSNPHSAGEGVVLSLSSSQQGLSHYHQAHHPTSSSSISTVHQSSLRPSMVSATATTSTSTTMTRPHTGGALQPLSQSQVNTANGAEQNNSASLDHTGAYYHQQQHHHYPPSNGSGRAGVRYAPQNATSSTASSRLSSQTRPSSVPPSASSSHHHPLQSSQPPPQPVSTPPPPTSAVADPSWVDKHLLQIPYCPKLIDDITNMYLQREREAVRAFNEGTTNNTPNIIELHKYYASPHYLQFQPDITPKMRVILVDWLIDVHKRFDHHRETLFLTVNIIDRYLSVVNTKYKPYYGVRRSRLQLVAVSAYLIATKYEQIIVPDLKEFVLVAAHSYTKKEVLAMESEICCALGFRFTVPTSYQFASRLLTVVEDSPLITRAEQPQRCMEQMFYLTNFFLEHALLDYNALQFTPSQVGNAAVFLAIHTLRVNGLGGGSPRGSPSPLDSSTAHSHPDSTSVVWSAALRQVSTASVQDFLGCADGILQYVETIRTNKYQAVRQKYSSSRCSEVAKLNMPVSLPNA